MNRKIDKKACSTHFNDQNEQIIYIANYVKIIAMGKYTKVIKLPQEEMDKLK